MGNSRGGRDRAVAGPHRRDGATGRRGGGRGAGRAGTKGTMSSGAKEGGGGSPAYHLPHPHPHPPQHAQYVGPYRLEKTLGKGQTGEPGEGTLWGAGAGGAGGRRRDSRVFKGHQLAAQTPGSLTEKELGVQLGSQDRVGKRLRLWGPGDEGSGVRYSCRILGPKGSHPVGAEVGGALAAVGKEGQPAAGMVAMRAEVLGAVQPQAGVRRRTGLRPGSYFPLHCPLASEGRWDDRE